MPADLHLASLVFLSVCLSKQEMVQWVPMLPHAAIQVMLQKFSHDSADLIILRAAWKQTNRLHFSLRFLKTSSSAQGAPLIQKPFFQDCYNTATTYIKKTLYAKELLQRELKSFL